MSCQTSSSTFPSEKDAILSGVVLPDTSLFPKEINTHSILKNKNPLIMNIEELKLKRKLNDVSVLTASGSEESLTNITYFSHYDDGYKKVSFKNSVATVYDVESYKDYNVESIFNGCSCNVF